MNPVDPLMSFAGDDPVAIFPAFDSKVRRHEVDLATDQNGDAQRIDEWLALLGGPGACPQAPGRGSGVLRRCVPPVPTGYFLCSFRN